MTNQIDSTKDVGIPFLSALSAEGLKRLGLSDTTTPAETIVANAVREGTCGFLCRDIRYEKEEPLATVRGILHRQVSFQVARAVDHRHRFRPLLEKCVRLKIRVMLLKGMALAEYVYSEDGYRDMCDIDFMVAASDRAAIASIMEEIGLEPNSHSNPVGYVNNQHNIAWHQDTARGYFRLECHWNIVPPYGPFPIKPEELWTRALRKEFDGLPVFTLSEEDSLLHACIHLHFHGYRGILRDYFDIYALLTRHEQLDWEELASRARKWNADSILYAVLSETGRLFNLDTTTREKVTEVYPRRLLHRKVVLPILQRRINSGSQTFDSHAKSKAESTSPSDVENLILAVCSGRISTLLGWVLPSRERLLERYDLRPNEWSPRYYLRYYPDIARRLFRSTWRFLHRMPKRDNADVGISMRSG